MATSPTITSCSTPICSTAPSCSAGRPVLTPPPDSTAPAIFPTFVGHPHNQLSVYPISSYSSLLPGNSLLDHYLIGQIQDLILVADAAEQRICSINEAALRCFELTEAEVIGQRIDHMLQFDPGAEAIEALRQLLVTEGLWEGVLGFTTRSGKHYFYHFRLQRIPKMDGLPDGFFAIGRNVTAERDAEEALLRRERFYHGLIADALDGILLLNPDGEITFASPSVRHVLGFIPEDLVGNNAFSYVHPDDRIKASQSFALEVNENPEVKFITVRLLCQNGEWRWCLVRGHNLLSNPAVGGIAVYFHDDTQRKKAAEALRDSEERFRTLIDNVQVGVMLHNAQHEVILCNAAAARLLGITVEGAKGRSSFDGGWDVICENGEALAPEDYPVPMAVRTGLPVRNYVMGHRQADSGQRVWLLVNSRPIFDENGHLLHVISTFADISDRRDLEQQLLAEQIAHQRALTQATIDSSENERTEIGKELHDNIGQQLTTIKLYLDLARATADEETVEMIALATRNISDVINEIRTLCRSLIPSTLGDLGLEESINELIHTFTRTQKLRIRFQSEGFNEENVADNQKLMLFRILQEQLNNIVKHSGARKVSVRLAQLPGRVLLEVVDDGIGFDPATVRRGIGLTNMRNRAEMFGGTVTINSAPGKGCTLNVSVPEAEKA
ncbi:MAG: PAS domain S-box protein [Chitinophagaceae bacterium]|nr:MAG: PAS domain S-box protein [Chitinophagaceae bacterium]